MELRRLERGDGYEMAGELLADTDESVEAALSQLQRLARGLT